MIYLKTNGNFIPVILKNKCTYMIGFTNLMPRLRGIMKEYKLERVRLAVEIPNILDERLRKLSKKKRTTKTRTVIRALLMYCTYEEKDLHGKIE